MYSCDKCYRHFTTQKVLEAHKCGSNKQHHCTECEKKYTYKFDLTQHIKSVHRGEGHKCEQCGKMLELKPSLNISKQRVSNSLSALTATTVVIINQLSLDISVSTLGSSTISDHTVGLVLLDKVI